MMEHNCSTLSLLIANNKTKTRDLNFATIALSCVNVWDLVRPVAVSCYLNLHLTRHSITCRERPTHFTDVCCTYFGYFWVGTRITSSSPDRFTSLSLPSNKFLPTCFLPTSAASADREHSRLYRLCKVVPCIVSHLEHRAALTCTSLILSRDWIKRVSTRLHWLTLLTC